jgi:hypothetical protein
MKLQSLFCNLARSSSFSPPAGFILWLAKKFWTQSTLPSKHQEAWRVAAAVLSTTLFIDALFLVLSLSVPSLSGLI